MNSPQKHVAKCGTDLFSAGMDIQKLRVNCASLGRMRVSCGCPCARKPGRMAMPAPATVACSCAVTLVLRSA